MQRFVDDDSGYLSWLAAHPSGFVLNTARKQMAAYLMLHRAGCGTIGGTPARGSRWTADYVKLCGDRAELEAFARRAVSAEPRRCGLCLRGIGADSRRSGSGAGSAGPPGDATPASPASDPVSISSSAVPPLVSVGGAAALDVTPAMFAMPAGPALQLAVAPRLASWNAVGDPGQIRLEAFRAATENLLRPQCERLTGPLALRLDVGLPPAIRLLDQHDLDNYLFPLAARLSRTAAGRLVSVWGTKQHGPVSHVRIERAIPVPRHSDGRYTIQTTRSAQSTAFKEQIRDQLSGAAILPPGPICLQLSFATGPRRNWLNLWKPVIDSLDQLLGRTRPDRSWHPQDGRIVELGLHWRADPALGDDILIAIAASAPRRA